jgi:hypothetical protein
MNNSVVINTAICLPAPDIEALIQGRAIAAMSKKYIVPERQFALCPVDASINVLPVEEYYQSNFLTIAKTALAQLNTENISIKAWVRCEKCEPIHNTESLSALSPLTIWTTESLQERLVQKQNIFLLYLRVYQLPKPITLSVKPNSLFTSLGQSLSIYELIPILSDRTFDKRKYQLETRQPPPHPQLEKLQSVIAQFANINLIAKHLDQDITTFLGWSTQKVKLHRDPDLEWIQTIADVGNSSDGDTFEKRVRQSLIKLGFFNTNINPKVSLDPNSTGGAGGLDFYCESPYPVVGECKATKTEKVADGTAAQLVKLGYKHLQQQYNRCIKIIMAAGELTEDAKLTASGNQMNVIRPETLQRLVELKAMHPGSIDLLELKPCLEEEPFGEAADAKLNFYINKIWHNIQLRAHLVQLVKNADRKVGIEYISGAYDASDSRKRIFNLQEMHEILIELSSPLTGYLGRIKGSDWKSDCFYFLRDLAINSK